MSQTGSRSSRQGSLGNSRDPAIPCAAVRFHLETKAYQGIIVNQRVIQASSRHLATQNVAEENHGMRGTAPNTYRLQRRALRATAEPDR